MASSDASVDPQDELARPRVRMRVVVYGGSGAVGRHVARALVAAGHSVTVAGRDPGRVHAAARELGATPPAPARVVALEDTDRLRTLASSAHLVVNCAGPFCETGMAVLDACLQAGVHYFDVSAESRFLTAVYSGRDAYASARGVTVCPGLGAKGALGDWALHTLVARHGPAARSHVAYAHAGTAYWRPSLGALLSVAHEGLAWEASHNAADPRAPRRFGFPSPFGTGYAVRVSGTEAVTIPWTTRTGTILSYLSVDPGTAANEAWGELHRPEMNPITRPAAPRLWAGLVHRRWREGLRRTLPQRGRGPMALHIEHGTARLSLRVDNPYATSAAIVAAATAALARAPAGVLAPSQLLDPAVALTALDRAELASRVGAATDDRSR